MTYLNHEIARATTADVQRAAEFLERAREVRRGCKQQRAKSRHNQKSGWRKHVDDSMNW
jgi:hypothetical protein